jgi:hypothetical protein
LCKPFHRASLYYAQRGIQDGEATVHGEIAQSGRRTPCGLLKRRMGIEDGNVPYGFA